MPFKDVENTDTQPLVNNPYGGNQRPLTASEKLVNTIYRATVLIGSIYYLHTLELYVTVLRSPKISHSWFKIGLATSIAILFVKFYVEIFMGKLNKKTVNYKNFRQSTHFIMFLLLLASVAFHISLWPAFGMQTVFIMTVIGYGILVQISLLLPIYVQNIGGVVSLTLFIQQYV